VRTASAGATRATRSRAQSAFCVLANMAPNYFVSDLEHVLCGAHGRAPQATEACAGAEGRLSLRLGQRGAREERGKSGAGDLKVEVQASRGCYRWAPETERVLLDGGGSRWTRPRGADPPGSRSGLVPSPSASSQALAQPEGPPSPPGAAAPLDSGRQSPAPRSVCSHTRSLSLHSQLAADPSLVRDLCSKDSWRPTCGVCSRHFSARAEAR
jgi:hypothetical protein